jgi:flagellin-like protein
MSLFTPRYLLVPKGGMKRKMNTRSKKALSPVVASIILIAVTVAVSIAVAAWMGALTFTFTATEQVSITNLTFQTGASGNINITASNTGTTPVTINEVWVNNVKQASISPALPDTLTANNQTMYTVAISVSAGYSYQVKLVSSKGNAFISTGTAPS